MLPWLLLACTSAPPCLQVSRPEPRPHSLTLSWPAQSRGDGQLTYTLDDTVYTVDAAREEGVWQVALSMLPPETVLSFEAREGDLLVCTDEVTTDPLPTGLPSWQASGQPSWEQLLGVAMGQSFALFILDDRGRYRWHHYDAEGRGMLEVAAADGLLHYNTLDPDRIDDVGAIVTLDRDSGAVLAETPAPGMHHAFAPLPGGGFAWLAVDVRDWTDPETGLTEAVVGDALWEASPDGDLREVFNLWDHLTPEPHDRWDNAFYERGRDWSHGNSVSYDEARDSYLVSMGNLDMILEIDRDSGAPLLQITPESWEISGEVYDFPHSPSWVDGERLLLFSYAEGAVGAVEYAVDPQARSLEAVWSHTRSESLLPFLGSARRLAEGSTLINYGASGIVEEVTAAGAVTWELRAGFGAWIGGAVPLP